MLETPSGASVIKGTKGLDSLVLGAVHAQSCLTFCDHMDSSVHEILQVRILEWVAISSSRGSCFSRD